MRLITTIRRVAEAILTAAGVVLGLTPDPTRAPMLVPVEREQIIARRQA